MSKSSQTSSIKDLHDIPLTCLRTAEFKNTLDAFEGKNIVIDFWTTKCTRCPDALDKLNSMAKQPQYANVEFASIVLDECDGARNIIETPDEQPRWNNIQHYYMDKDYKEHAKSMLGFNQVPFYAIINESGQIVQKGNKKQVNFDDVPGIIRLVEEKEREVEETKTEERVFCMDDDF
mmetsp:Transcript_16891/g.21369  ORF Transcript_16891/g.21369 Transcript_16891/m.21369 type:complete len:177 (-) Transcript_16891:67-597(-)|eukprot:CAMPEP_0203641650 /NCGR_PEP_ID=MMETSP0088-20131115/6997_1 /ASSEMBLY_ACC=CAM_ASM_001087 /TAXON_ID=426623 /ORGANISM="Chaetoceros affinis, Strain CCMP159" /LENGTH=176 /DNA_ID=CAMNT_0050497191 /DNA_START=36 /DNA_END=566 /DNA_ORIENTATION=-